MFGLLSRPSRGTASGSRRRVRQHAVGPIVVCAAARFPRRPATGVISVQLPRHFRLSRSHASRVMAPGRSAGIFRLRSGVSASARFPSVSQAAEPIAAFDLDVEGNAAKDVDALRRIFGLEPGTVVSPRTVLRIALPEDVPKIKAALNAAFDAAGDGVYEADYRIQRQATARSAGSPPAANSFSRRAARFA